jgi:small subunit ribosomal protein S8
VAAPALISASLGCVVFVFGSWPIREKCQEWLRRVGKGGKMVSDPIGDMLSRIRNGYLAGKRTVVVPLSGFKEKLAQILIKDGFLKGVERREQDLVLKLKYVQGQAVVQGLKRVSKPGRRIYQKAKDIKVVRSALGRKIISSPQGLVTDQEARKRKLGGEVICELW